MVNRKYNIQVSHVLHIAKLSCSGIGSRSRATLLQVVVSTIPHTHTRCRHPLITTATITSMVNRNIIIKRYHSVPHIAKLQGA